MTEKCPTCKCSDNAFVSIRQMNPEFDCNDPWHSDKHLRDKGLCEDEGCPHHGTPHVCTYRQTTDPWHPMSDPVDIKTIGKFLEELGEGVSAAARSLIQQIDGKEPTTGKSNKEWMEDEIADILANAELNIERFKLDGHRIGARVELKKARLRAWHKEA